MYGPAARYLLFYIGGVLLVAGGHLPWWVGFGAIFCLRRPAVFFFLACLLSGPKAKPEELQGKSVLVMLMDLPEKRGASYRTTGEIFGSSREGSWRKGSGSVQIYLPQAYSPGQLLEIHEGVRRLPPPRNAYEFDYSSYLQRQGIDYKCFLREEDYVLRGQVAALPWSLSARVYLHEVYLKYIGPGPSLGIAEAMVAGLKSEVDAEVEEAYITTGTVHALAVSGMHVALLFWMLNLLLSRVVPRRSVWYVLLLLGALWAYALFTGLSASVCRSVLMFSLFLVGDFLRRCGSSLNTLFVSALVLLMVKPMWLFDIGFQLSYLAVWGILELNPILARGYRPRFLVVRYLWESTTVTLSATAYTLPLTVYYFHQFPNYFLLANPLVNLICTPLLPLGLLLLIPVPGLASFLGTGMRMLIEVMNGVVREIAGWPGALTEQIYVSGITLALSFALLFCTRRWLAEREVKTVWMGSICLFLMFVQESRALLGQKRQEELVFHEQGFSLVAGKKESRFGSEEQNNALATYRLEKGISLVETRQIEGNFLVDTDLGRVIWLRKKQDVGLENVNFVLISNEAGIPERLPLGANVILDKTNSLPYIEKLRSRGVKVTNLRVEGLKIISNEQTI